MDGLGIGLIVMCALLAILFIVARCLKGGLLGVVLKTIASFGFVTSGIIGLIVSDATTIKGILWGSGDYAKWILGLIVIGLVLGMIGDIILDLKVVYPGNDKYFLNTGMGSFFLGHVCYIIAFTLWARPLAHVSSAFTVWEAVLGGVGLAVVGTIGIVLSSKKMGLTFGNYIVQTISYTLILTFTMFYCLLLAIFFGSGLWLSFVAMLVFFLSDVVLSMQYFGGKIASKPLIAINHALYYAAQIMLVAVIFAF
ncbi:MAG: hypothetical protein E7356_02580 [Clostridiales bacterium]|nr:hypothetical protein [Clostridiales bacterium]